ncbi:MAG TPA: lytic transglycosylase domain-containing protein, partial [Gemmatimonadaceae bacterium]|nr:lytic transglycosylase domain-containing protein [Gemmatimonadaceae bacterium]
MLRTSITQASRVVTVGRFRSLALSTVLGLSALALQPRVAAATSFSILEKAETAVLATAGDPGRGSSAGLPNLDHPRVDSWIKRFTTDLRSSFAAYLTRMTKYDDMIQGKLSSRGMPEGLIYLAMIESGFNPQARSPARASGLWQFVASTGRRFGLTINGRTDERNNPARATDAALSYLTYLHQKFGSWYLAAAAYNSGEGTVSRTMKQVLGRTKGSDADYYRISSRLPKETRD